MLEHLMRVHDVKRAVVRLEGVEVADRELDVRTAAGIAACLLDHIGRRIDAEDTSGRNPPADVSRDRARPAPEVEHAGAGCEVRCEVRGRVVERTPLVRPQYAFVVTVGVGHWFLRFVSQRSAHHDGTRRTGRTEFDGLLNASRHLFSRHRDESEPREVGLRRRRQQENGRCPKRLRQRDGRVGQPMAQTMAARR
jgi:hypothetical protein